MPDTFCAFCSTKLPLSGQKRTYQVCQNCRPAFMRDVAFLCRLMIMGEEQEDDTEKGLRINSPKRTFPRPKVPMLTASEWTARAAERIRELGRAY